MSVSLFVAPAGSGKTEFTLSLIRQKMVGLGPFPRVCVANRLQVTSWYRRLAAAGGALGIQVTTFDQLYVACLDAAHETYTRIEEAVEYRLLRTIVNDLPLTFYGPIKGHAGFIQELQRLIREFKSARVLPERLQAAVELRGNEPRLRELVDIYQQYEQRLAEQGWSDYAGLGWLAVEAFTIRAPDAGKDWPLLIVDGFDSFTETEMALLNVLAGRVGRLVITLTGDANADEPRRAHRRFFQTRQRLETVFGIQAQRLPAQRSIEAHSLYHLSTHLFQLGAPQLGDDGRVRLIAAADHAAEVREALRWLKRRAIEDEVAPHDLALVARDLEPYRPFILQTAAEFNMQVHMPDGVPLQQNPCIAALLNLLRLMLPVEQPLGLQRENGRLDHPALTRRAVIAAWRSPYFDWASATSGDAENIIGISPEDAVALDSAARWGRVISGLDQWHEMFASLGHTPISKEGRADLDDEEELSATGPLTNTRQAAQLRLKFNRFVERMTPPHGVNPYRTYVEWLEELIGDDSAEEAAGTNETTGLNVVQRIRKSEPFTVFRDLTALQKLKTILRSFVWSEEAEIVKEPVTFSTFFQELAGAVEGMTYHPYSNNEALHVTNVIEARGIPFRAIALLGLAETRFPAVLNENSFLRESDREALRLGHNLPLASRMESAEAEFFYETITRAREQLLLTRPRLAEGGAIWEASPFWEEVKRLLAIEPQRIESEQIPAPSVVASLPELLESLGSPTYIAPSHDVAQAWIREQVPGRWTGMESAAGIFRQRYSAQKSRYDGYLHEDGAHFALVFGNDYIWSATRLERYLNCALSFFFADVLQQRARLEPAEGLDARQLGSLYHQILEAVYRRVPPSHANDYEALTQALAAIAGSILDEAPEREGFRATAWWDQTKAEIVKNVKACLQKMAEMASDFVPTYFEMGFFGDRRLAIGDGSDQFYVHGIVDRIDVDEQGRFYIIDYKTTGPSEFNARTLSEGRKLQLPIYALAARDALELGELVDGFYWHVRHAEASPLRLADYGPEKAIETAQKFAWQVVKGARGGEFMPTPPAGGCKAYCPGATFCWHYRPRASW